MCKAPSSNPSNTKKRRRRRRRSYKLLYSHDFFKKIENKRNKSKCQGICGEVAIYLSCIRIHIMTEKQSGIDKEEYRQMVLLRMVSHIEYIFLCDVHCQEILIYHLQ
jgi:hypothetical protein